MSLLDVEMFMMSIEQKKANKVSFFLFAVELAFVLVIPMVLLAFLGHAIDKFTNKSFFLILFTIVGMIISSIITVKKVLRAIERVSEDDEKKLAN